MNCCHFVYRAPIGGYEVSGHSLAKLDKRPRYLLFYIYDYSHRARRQTYKRTRKRKGYRRPNITIIVEAGGCSGLEYGMSFDSPKEDDCVLEDKGIQFAMDPTSLEYMQGSEVDFDDGLNGKGFDIKNPNATSTCGCGRSFN